MFVKDLTNDQSVGGDHLAELREHFAVLKEAVSRLGFHLGLESGSVPSGSAGSGSQDALKRYQDPETTLSELRRQVREARSRAAKCGVRVG
jgi:hypothetical protein